MKLQAFDWNLHIRKSKLHVIFPVSRGKTPSFSRLHFLLLVVLYASYFAHKVNRLKSDVNKMVVSHFHSLGVVHFFRYVLNNILYTEEFAQCIGYRFNNTVETSWESMWFKEMWNMSADSRRRGSNIDAYIMICNDMRCFVELLYSDALIDKIRKRK